MATTFPFNLSNTANLKNPSGNIPRFNFKADGTYSITSGISVNSGPLAIQGYSSIVGDFGRPTIDAGTNSVVILTLGIQNIVYDLILQNNGTVGSNDGMIVSQQNVIGRCVVNNVRGNGFNVSNTFTVVTECEAYSCNLANVAGSGGFIASSSEITFQNCISHDNAGSNNDGFTTSSGASSLTWTNCIADTNGRHGFSILPVTSGNLIWLSCDCYNNGGDGIKFTNTTTNVNVAAIKNSNFIKNSGWGINASLTTGRMWGNIDNCGFGSGTQVNGSGTTNNTDSMVISGSVTYASNVTPWVDPANGNFSVNLAAAINAGRGSFTETQGGYSGTVGYPVIGAAQSNSITQSPAWAGGDFILPAGYLTHAYLYEWRFTVATSFSLVSGSLPSGLTLLTVDPDTAEIVGTPTAIGAFTFVLRATVGTSTGDATFHIAINADPDEGIGGLLGGLRPTC